MGKAHMGIAVPLSPDDLEHELKDTATDRPKPKHETSTSKEGISTWILLSGGKPTKEPEKKVTAKIEKITKSEVVKQQSPMFIRPTTSSVKPVFKPKVSTTIAPPTTLSTSKKPTTERPQIKVSATQRPTPIRRKKPIVLEPRPPMVTKKAVKKTTNATATTTTTTTEASQSSTWNLSAEMVEVTPSSVETTTFLILEPKDADFDMPEDRSPGTTKSPKRKVNANKNKTKKNKTKENAIGEKKPSKNPLAKEKPITTQIYNYLAREIMPSVGVGLVGLAVTAGLATYFFSPFGALRRSYDIADRKDDMYFYNNEEYAAGGDAGQSEEEVFGKVIAGMPVDAPYRKSVKFTPNGRPNHVHQQGVRPGPNYGPGYDSLRYRNQPHAQQQPHPVYKKTPHHTQAYQQSYPQKYFRNNDQSMYRNNAAQPIAATSGQADEQTPSGEKNVEIVYPKPEDDLPKLEDILESATSEKPFDDSNILRRRTHFVVASAQPSRTEPAETQHEAATVDERTVDAVPEHGPRRRRRKRETYIDQEGNNFLSNEINSSDNELDAVITDRIESSTVESESTNVTTESITVDDQRPTQATDKEKRVDEFIKWFFANFRSHLEIIQQASSKIVHSFFSFARSPSLRFLGLGRSSQGNVLPEIQTDVD